MADLNQKLNDLGKTTDRTSEYDQNDIQKNKGMALLSYLSILVLIPIFCAKDSKFARFHANQGLVLAIAEIVIAVALGVIGGILGALSAIPAIGVLFHIAAIIFSVIGYVLDLGFLVLSILGIVNALNGQAKELPVVGKYTILK